jgi:hypothetical protein
MNRTSIGSLPAWPEMPLREMIDIPAMDRVAR